MGAGEHDRQRLAESFVEQPGQTSVSWRDDLGGHIVLRQDFSARELYEAGVRVRDRKLRERVSNWRNRNRGIDLDGWKWWII